MTPLDNIELLGGEMLAWSDLDQGNAAAGRAMAQLIGGLATPGSRVLLAGPHRGSTIDVLLAAGVELTCLVRGYPDAQVMAAHAARVLVGGVDRLPPDRDFDLIVAGGGLSVLSSTEGEPLAWDGALAGLAARLKPLGRLVVAVDNPLGVDRLAAPAPWFIAREDSAWRVEGPPSQHRPVNLAQTRLRVAAVGLRAEAEFASYPHSANHELLLRPAAFDRAPGLVDASLRQMYAEGIGGRELLRDPAHLATDALHAGLGMALAPGWLVVASRASGDSAQTAYPLALIGSGPADRAAPCVSELVEAADGLRRRVLPLPATPEAVNLGRLPAPGKPSPRAWRDAARLDAQVPNGRLLLTALVDAGARQDLAELRALLAGYGRWLGAHAVDRAELPGELVFATADNVLVCDDSFVCLDRSWRPVGTVALRIALARVVWRLAVVLSTEGYASPWPSTLDTAGLAIVLAGLAGHNLDREAIQEAIDLEARLTAARAAMTADEERALRARLAETVSTQPPPGFASATGMREALRRQADELVRLRARLEWSEKMLDSRETALRHVESVLEVAKGSLTYRLGHALLMPVKLVKGTVSGFLRARRERQARLIEQANVSKSIKARSDQLSRD